MRNGLFILFFLLSSAMYAERWVGGDISMLPEYETHNSAYKDAAGVVIPDLVTWLHTECNWNLFRVRLFVNPTNPNHDGVVQDLDYVTALGQRIKAAGASFMLDIHYSDTWVDALHIQAPEAWKGSNDSVMADSVGAYTRRVLHHLNDANASPDFVQVGNEIMFGLCDIQVHPYYVAGDNWKGYLGLLRAGSQAVREVCPDAQIILHTDRPCDTTATSYYYQRVVDAGIDFDVMGLSYYPFWHGYMTPEQNKAANLTTSLTMLANRFPNHRVQIVETAYNFQHWSSQGIHYDTRSTWPCSKAGQYQMISDLMDVLNGFPQVTGLCYWFPEEAGNGDDTDWKKQSYGTVISTWLNRGFFACEQSSTGHNLHAVNSSDIAHLMGQFAIPSTALNDVSQGLTWNKYLINHHLFIQHHGTTYTISGACY